MDYIFRGIYQQRGYIEIQGAAMALIPPALFSGLHTDPALAKWLGQ